MDLDSALRSPAYGLGIDTTTAVLTLALGSQTEGVPRVKTWFLERAMSAQLHPLLRDFMPPQQWSDLAWIAVANGPGSFTGTRLGVVTARTLAQQLQVPLFGLSNLAIAAWLAAAQQPVRLQIIAVSQPGQQGMVYGAVYRVPPNAGVPHPVVPDRLCSLEAWQQEVSRQPHLDQVITPGTTPTGDMTPAVGKALLSLGWYAWNQGDRPGWEQVLPYYG